MITLTWRQGAKIWILNIFGFSNNVCCQNSHYISRSYTGNKWYVMQTLCYNSGQVLLYYKLTSICSAMMRTSVARGTCGVLGNYLCAYATHTFHESCVASLFYYMHSFYNINCVIFLHLLYQKRSDSRFFVSSLNKHLYYHPDKNKVLNKKTSL